MLIDKRGDDNGNVRVYPAKKKDTFPYFEMMMYTAFMDKDADEDILLREGHNMSFNLIWKLFR